MCVRPLPEYPNYNKKYIKENIYFVIIYRIRWIIFYLYGSVLSGFFG